MGPNGATMVVQTPSTHQNLLNLILFENELVCPAVFSRRSAVTNDLVTKKCDFAKKVKFRSYQKKAKKSDFAHLAALKNIFFRRNFSFRID